MSLIIDINRLRQRVGATEVFQVESDQLDLPPDLVLNRPLEISLEVTNTGTVYVMKGRLLAQIRARCNRCLEEILLSIGTNFEEKLVNSGDLSQLSEIDQQGLEEEYRLFEKDAIDLTEIMTEHIYNEIPLKVLCSIDCQGLCINCGKNLNQENCQCVVENIDPRLAILANFNKD